MIPDWNKGDPLSAYKLNQTVRAVNGIINSGGPSIPRFHTQKFIEITEATPTDGEQTFQWTYKVKLLHQSGIKGYTTETTDPFTTEVENIEAFNIFEDTKQSHYPVPVGTRCRGNIYYDENRMYVWFWFQNTMSPFLVKVRKIDGVEGSSSVNCSWVYDVYGLHDDPDDADTEPLGEAMTPVRPRFSLTAYTFAPDDSLGLACKDASGFFTLLECYEEFPQQDECT